MSEVGDASFRRAEIHPPFGLSGVVASAGRLVQVTWRETLPVFLLVSAALSILPAIFLVDLGESLILPLYLIIQVVLPAFLASVAFGIAAVIFDRSERSGSPTERPRTQALAVVKERAKDVATTALFAGMICLALATFLGPLGLLLLGTLFGPPIVMQVICVERMTLQEGWARTREISKGHALRVMAYLLTIALGVGVFGALVVSLVSRSITASPARGIAFALVQIVVLSVTLPFLAAAQYACYRDLSYRSSVD